MAGVDNNERRLLLPIAIGIAMTSPYNIIYSVIANEARVKQSQKTASS